MNRNILHLRVNGFPVAVERLRDPLLKGKPNISAKRRVKLAPKKYAEIQARRVLSPKNQSDKADRPIRIELACEPER